MSDNYALSKGFEHFVEDGSAMTVRGTVNKTFLLLGIVALSFGYSWVFLPGSALGPLVLGGSALGGFIIGMITIFYPTAAPYTSWIYALLEGVFLGFISSIFETKYPGIVMSAVMLTFTAVAGTLMIYRQTPEIAGRIRKGVIIATFAIFVAYILGLVCSLFGVHLAIFGGGLIGIGFSLLVVGVAVLNLILDYDFILTNAKNGAPGYMEWYAAFGLMVTMIWVYLEILRLLAKISRSR